MNRLNLYEKKIIGDQEFPVQYFINKLQRRGEYFYLHWHEHMELHYIVKGSSLFQCNQDNIKGVEGSLIIFNSNELHRGVMEEKECEAIVMIFDMSSMSQELAHTSMIFQNVIEKDEFIQKRMLDISRENEEKKMGYKLAAKGILYELLTYLVRNYALERLNEKENIRRSKNLIRLNTVVQYIQEHYAETISNQELAELVHLSEDRFNHLFRDSMGISPLNYMNDIRLRKAKNLLETQNLTVSEVALEVGISDFNHFTRMFRKKYGCPPSKI